MSHVPIARRSRRSLAPTRASLARVLSPLIVAVLLLGHVAGLGRPLPAAAEGPDAIVDLAGCTTSSLAANDDGSTGFLNLGFQANFYGNRFTGLYINNNGNVTFSQRLSTYTPFGLQAASTVIIAPFFADVQTNISGSDIVRYGQATYEGKAAFCVNWVNVKFYGGASSSNRNSFQLLVVDRSDIQVGDFDFIFNYDKITWEAGTYSGGNSNGLGGQTARAGYSNGINASYEIPGSGVAGAFLDSNTTSGLIHNSKDSSQLGRYVFEVRNHSVVGDPTPWQTKPLVTVPGPLVAEATGPDGAAVTFAATAIAPDGSPLTPVCTAGGNPVSSGSVFPLGVTTVTCTATDASNGTDSASFAVTVRDTTPPVIAPASNLPAGTTDPAGAYVTYPSPATSDAVDGPGIASCTPASGELFPLGTTTVTCTATDAAGNAATPVTFNVDVVLQEPGNTAPVLAAIADQTVEEGSSVQVPVAATDVDGDALTLTASNLPPFATFVDHGNGSGTLTIAPGLGAAATYSGVTIVADDGEDTATRTFTITVVPDSVPPVTTATTNPANAWSRTQVTVTLNATDAGVGVASLTYGATGAASFDPITVPGNSATFTIGTEGVTTIAFYATDLAGNDEPVRTVEVGIDRVQPTLGNPRLELASALLLASPSISYTASWDAADTGGGLDRYQLQRSPDGGATWISLGITRLTSQTITVPADTEVRLRVRPIDLADNYGDWVHFPVRTDLLVQDNDATRVEYRGTWRLNDVAWGSGDSATSSPATGSVARLKFSGPSVALVMPTNSTFGIAAVSLNGTHVADIDLYSPTLRPRQVVFQQTLDGDGPHLLEISVTGRKHADSRGTLVFLDAVIVNGALDGDTTPPVVTPAGVTFAASALPTVGASLPLVATWSAEDHAGVGGYDVQRSVDGVTWLPVLTQTTLRSATLTVQAGDPLYLRVRARDTLGNQSDWVVSGPFTSSLLQEDHHAITYTGVWKPATHVTDSAGAAQAAAASGSSATLQFTGREVALVMPKTVAMGIVEVWIDGAYVTTIDTYSATAVRRQVVFHRAFETSGEHTIEVRVTGTKHASSLSAWVYVDAFVVIN
jgi:hypothetical protein